MRVVGSVCIPGLPYAVPAETVVTFCQHHGIHERTATDGTHEVVVVGRDIVEQAEVDRGVVVLLSLLAVLVMVLLHASSLLQPSHTAQLYCHARASGIFGGPLE
jgi:hypothetical protein